MIQMDFFIKILDNFTKKFIYRIFISIKKENHVIVRTFQNLLYFSNHTFAFYICTILQALIL